MKRLFAAVILLFASPAISQEMETRATSFNIGEQTCNIPVPSCVDPTKCTNGSYTFHLPPDVPDPVEIAEVTIDNEIPWPSNLTPGLGGAWFAAIDPASRFSSCSKWPAEQDCPIIHNWTQQSNQFSYLKEIGMMPLGQQLSRFSTRGNWYHKGDAIIIGTPCYTATGGTVHPNITFKYLVPKATPTSTCDSNTKLLLHGNLFKSPANKQPLANFIADSSPSWHPVANRPQGISSPTVSIEATAGPLGPTSIRFDGTTNTGAWINASSDTVLGSDNWTMELFWRPGSVGAQFQHIFGWKGYAGFLLGQQGSQLYFAATSNGTSWNIHSGAWGAVALNTWAHIVIQRVGNVIELKQDGSLKQSIAVSGALFDLAKSPVYFGNNYNKTLPATGNVQEQRFSSVARFPVGAYTVPSVPYPCP